MAERSAISWTDATWNPVRGCTRVSPGCEHCYAEELTAKWRSTWGAGFAEKTKAGPRWTRKVQLLPHMLDRPLKWKQPRRIFVNSLSDLFHESLSNQAIAAVMGIAAAAHWHTLQILTKRAGRMPKWFSWIDEQSARTGRRQSILCGEYAETLLGRSLGVAKIVPSWPLPNVWLGVSAEDQERADERIPTLLRCPAAVRFVSYEPALGPVKFGGSRHDWLEGWDTAEEHAYGCDGSCSRGQCPIPVQVQTPRIDWLIAGGESGPNRRPCEVAWFESAARQCQEAGVAFFMKQDGAFKPGQQGRIPDELWARKEFPAA